MTNEEVRALRAGYDRILRGLFLQRKNPRVKIFHKNRDGDFKEIYASERSHDLYLRSECRMDRGRGDWRHPTEPGMRDYFLLSVVVLVDHERKSPTWRQ